MGILFNVADFLLSIIVVAALLVWNVIRFITHPVWFPWMIFKRPEIAADFIYANYDYDELKWPWANQVISWSIKCSGKIIGWIWRPFIALLPVKRRIAFIDASPKSLSEYGEKTQLKYFELADDSCKKHLIEKMRFSKKVMKKLWDMHPEIFIECGHLTEKQVNDLLNGRTERGSLGGKLLLDYLLKYTPSKELLNKIIDSKTNIAYITMLGYIKQRRPNGLLVSKLLNTFSGQMQRNEIANVVTRYAGMDAVVGDINATMEQQKAAWENFCRHHKHLAEEAQKKMQFWQYKVYAETEHHLSLWVLSYMLATVADREYLEAICRHEFDRISGDHVFILQAEGWRYATYLQVLDDMQKNNS